MPKVARKTKTPDKPAAQKRVGLKKPAQRASTKTALMVEVPWIHLDVTALSLAGKVIPATVRFWVHETVFDTGPWDGKRRGIYATRSPCNLDVAAGGKRVSLHLESGLRCDLSLKLTIS